jgi:SAM-dependent methyltransferase
MGNILSTISLGPEVSEAKIIEIFPPTMTVGDVYSYNETSDINNLLSVINNKLDNVSEKIGKMRRIHNQIKGTLISNAARKVSSKRLLDIAVGKAGDLNKWVNAGITHVYGFDINPVSIEEGRRRYADLEKKKQLKTVILKSTQQLGWYTSKKKEFEWDLTLDDGSEIPAQSFGIVSCQFAIHYFSNDPSRLNALFQFVNNYLQPDGFFIGTTISDEALSELMRSEKSFKNRYFSIDGYTGRQYSIHINGTDYYESEGAKTREYVVNMKQLVSVAKENGFIVVETLQFNHPKYSSFYTELLDCKQLPECKELLECSYLNTTFVFQKKKNADSTNGEVRSVKQTQGRSGRNINRTKL